MGEQTVGDRWYEAQNVLYPIPTCGRRAAAAHEATRLCRAETSGEVGGHRKSRITARFSAAISRVAWNPSHREKAA